MKTVPRWVVAGATAYVAVAWAVTVVAGERQPAASAATLLELGAPVTAALLCRRASRRLGSRGWRFLALGCALWGAGEVAWLLLVAAGRESPFPSLADAGYLGGAGCFLAGMFALFFRRLSLAQHVRAGVDGLIASLALFFVFGALLESAVRQAHDLSLLAEWVALGYPIADLLVLSLVLTTLLGVGRRVDLLLLTATFGAMLTADLLFSYQATVGTYEHLYLPDLGWLSAFVLLAFAAAHAAPMPVERSRHVGYGRPVLYVSLGAAACTGLAQVLLHGSLRVTESLTALVLTFFAVARQFATETENRTLTDQLHRQVERAEATSARLEAVFDASRDPMVLVGPDRRVVEANRAAGRLYGLSPHDMVGMPASDLVHPNDLRTAAAAIELFVDQREVAPTTFRVVAADGAERWVEVTGANLLADPAVGALVVTLHDVTERKASAERMAYEAVHDQMTGLANRARFLEVAADAIAERDRVGGEVAIVFIDLDRFKVVNDSLGHQAGDRVLQVTAERLQANVRPTDLVARLGGDEFTVLLPGIREPAQAVEVAERVAAAIRQPITLDDGDTIITASIGVSIASPEITADMAELLLRDADLAMYRAKETGRARTELYADGTPRRERQTRLRIATDLHRAIERDELRVAYQPVVDLDNGRVTGFEALVRWQHPERGLLGPAEFVELAEDTGLITPIGEWVLSTACRRLAQWNDARAHTGLAQLSMAVNLSPRQLGDAALPDRVRACVAAAGVDPGLVWLEITENALMRETATAISVLRELRRVGVRLAVDDFGTGYSSLAYLKRFPVEALKIDRTFTDGLGSDPEDSAIVAAVVGMAHALNLEAVAEGLETYGQLAELRRLGCDRAQGYLFGRPMSAAELGPRPADDLSVWRTEPGTRSAEHLRPL